MAVYHLLVNRKIPGRLTSKNKLNQFEKTVNNKTKNDKNGSKMRPERSGTPFKRRAMENYVGLYLINAFTSSVARVFVEKTLGN